MKKLRYILEYFAVVTLAFALRLCPLGCVLWIGRRFGDVAFFLIGIRKKVVMQNLKIAFPGKTMSELRTIARDTYRNAGMSFIEMLVLPNLRHLDSADFIEFEGLEYLQRLIKENRGAVLVGAHFGSWELLGAVLCKKGIPLDVLVYKQHNDLFNKYLESTRRKMGIGLIPMKFALRAAMKALKKGRMVALLADQDAGARDGIFIDFFGRPASTNRGSATFALRAGAPVIVGYCVRLNQPAKHKIGFLPVEFEQTGDYAGDVRRLTEIFTKHLETVIKEHPSQWFWFHKKWKTTPPGWKKIYD